jgi:hypothetical protein
MMDPRPDRLAASIALNDRVRGVLMGAGFAVRLTPWTKDRIGQRLSSWLSQCFGTLPLPYEVNSLTPKRQLSLAEIRQIGRCIAIGAGEYCASDAGGSFLRKVDDIRRRRAAEWAATAAANISTDPIESEYIVAQRIEATQNAETARPSSASVTTTQGVP